MAFGFSVGAADFLDKLLPPDWSVPAAVVAGSALVPIDDTPIGDA
jgi:hypothetical protein